MGVCPRATHVSVLPTRHQRCSGPTCYSPPYLSNRPSVDGHVQRAREGDLPSPLGRDRGPQAALRAPLVPEGNRQCRRSVYALAHGEPDATGGDPRRRWRRAAVRSEKPVSLSLGSSIGQVNGLQRPADEVCFPSGRMHNELAPIPPLPRPPARPATTRPLRRPT